MKTRPGARSGGGDVITWMDAAPFKDPGYNRIPEPGPVFKPLTQVAETGLSLSELDPGSSLMEEFHPFFCCLDLIIGDWANLAIFNISLLLLYHKEYKSRNVFEI